jgi:PAS domain S-box-containing protein
LQRKKLAAAGVVFREELRYWVADGSERMVDFAMHPIRGQSGVVTFLHPTGIDITERKKIEATLRERENRLSWLASIDAI